MKKLFCVVLVCGSAVSASEADKKTESAKISDTRLMLLDWAKKRCNLIISGLGKGVYDNRCDQEMKWLQSCLSAYEKAKTEADAKTALQSTVRHIENRFPLKKSSDGKTNVVDYSKWRSYEPIKVESKESKEAQREQKK